VFVAPRRPASLESSPRLLNRGERDDPRPRTFNNSSRGPCLVCHVNTSTEGARNAPGDAFNLRVVLEFEDESRHSISTGLLVHRACLGPLPGGIRVVDEFGRPLRRAVREERSQ
jgi:hypothetical protein